MYQQQQKHVAVINLNKLSYEYIYIPNESVNKGKYDYKDSLTKTYSVREEIESKYLFDKKYQEIKKKLPTINDINDKKSIYIMQDKTSLNKSVA